MDILNHIVAALTGFGFVILNLFGASSVPALENIVSHPGDSIPTAATTTDAAAAQAGASVSGGGKVYTQADLLALAGDDFASGTVPLGDYKYVTSGPKQGYVYLCNPRKDNPGSMVNGPWINGNTWNFLQKASVDGAVSWKSATFSDMLSGASRILSGNDLPVGQTTGVFPVARTDDAYQYDPNPNSIKAQSIKFTLPAHPSYSATPYCMGMEVGVMTNGVTLFNGFDAGLRDAAAHELQDSNDGHPQGNDQYHYHSLPAWAHTASVSTVIGFAYDGFPITGPVVAPGKYLTTSDLDECHGLTSAITLDGKSVTTYHYVMTYDFPYSASCFRGKPVTTGPSVAPNGTQGQQASGTQQQGSGAPPAAAIAACSGKSSGSSCSFAGGAGGTVSGTCQTPPGASLACVPAR